MMERDLESIYDLLLATLENRDSKSNSEGSCHPLRECNMLHLSEDGRHRWRTRRTTPI